MKRLCALLTLCILAVPLGWASADIVEIPININVTITQEDIDNFLSIIPADWDWSKWDPATDGMPQWLQPVIDDLLGWMKDYDPENPFLDPDHPISVTMTNNSLVPWTDFHFDILPHPSIPGDMSNFSIEEVSPAPSMVHPRGLAPDGIVVTNTTTPAQGPQVHYWHWSGAKPILPGETATYNFLLHNPDNQAFKLNFYPTLDIPEPVTLLLLSCGVAALWRRR